MVQYQIAGIDFADLMVDLREGETPEDYIHPEFKRPYTRQELVQARYAAREERREAAAEEDLEARRIRAEAEDERAAEKARAEADEDQFEAGVRAALAFRI